MINKDNNDFFYLPSEADGWVWRVVHYVGPWISLQKDKSLWKLVLWVSKRNSILDKKITIKQFCNLVVEECGNALSEKENADTLFHNIQKFKYTELLDTYDTQKELSKIHQSAGKVEEMLSMPINTDQSSSTYTLEGRMREFLDNAVATGKYDIIRIKPVYDGKQATMSVESFMSQKFVDENRPSQVVIFQCIDDEITEDTVDMYSGRFCKRNNTKLFLASTHTYNRKIQKAAESQNIGLIYVNPNYEVTENNIVLPRSVNKHTYVYWYDMLSGNVEMTLPIIIRDGGFLFYSLSDLLSRYNFKTISSNRIRAPFYFESEIEKETLKLTQPIVDDYVEQLQKCDQNDKVPACAINPYMLAKQLGLTVVRAYIDDKYGKIDIEHKTVTLNKCYSEKDPLDHFSMAHETGHYILHSDIVENIRKCKMSIEPREEGLIEYQANLFASYLLMPTKVIGLLYDIYWKKEFKRQVVKPLLVKGYYFQQPSFQRVVGPISRKMGVSLEAAAIRLKKMGYLVEEVPLPFTR